MLRIFNLKNATLDRPLICDKFKNYRSFRLIGIYGRKKL